MISFGPIHHGKENTKEAEQYKLLWTSKFVAEYSEKRCIQDPDRTGEYKRLGIVVVSIQNPKPIHLLDYYRSTYLSPQVHLDAHTYEPREKRKILRKYNEPDKYDNQIVSPISWHTCKNIQELKTVGIRVKANKLHKNNALAWSNITFTSKWFGGELRLPVFDFSDSTPYFLWNVMAYEMCPDVDYKYECCSYFSFMDSLIDTVEDVKELRLAGVFQNLLGSDQDLANLFNELGNDLPTKLYSNVFHSQSVAYSKKYIMIKHQIENHYKTKWRTWLALAYNTYCNTPWTMIAFLAAFLALVLTFIQTWFTIHPNN
ncbi:hypothetical protein RJT34_25453 [Clitoria ternatea]|uniref:Uncharacterized protein n=1 Tax=Clitoria ternatea TaxID=43366 RepID=A0AAN9IIV3_CLITE